MQVTETKSEGLSREFKVALPANEIEEKISHRLKELARTAQMPGFRPGKVPVSVLRKKYGPSVLGEVLERAVNDSSQQALAEKGLRPAMQPQIEITSFEDGGDLEYTIGVELLPEIKPVDFSKIKLERLIPKTDDAAMENTLADIAADEVQALGQELGADVVAPDAIMSVACDVFSPNALGATLDEAGIARLDCSIVAGGANNQLARPENGAMLAERGILYAPDYVINAGGIISVTMEYLCRRDDAPCDINEVRKRIALIPERLSKIWQDSEATGSSPDRVADAMAQKLIGRG